MKSELEGFFAHFNSVIHEVQKYKIFVRGREFHVASITTLQKLIAECSRKKVEAIKSVEEESANCFLAMEFTAHAFVGEFKLYLALKDDQPDLAWDHLIDAQCLAAKAMKAHQIADQLKEYVTHLRDLETILFPEPTFLSAGLIIERSECNICGQEYGECTHIIGRPYLGKLCERIRRKFKATEISVVENPADRHCRVQYFAEGQSWYNVCSLRTVSEDVVKHTPTERCVEGRFM